MHEGKMILLPCEAEAPAGEGFRRVEADKALLCAAADALDGAAIPAPCILAPRHMLARALHAPEGHEALLTAWRGALTTAFLMDCWADVPEMTVRTLEGGTPLADAVRAALPAQAQSLRLLLLGGKPLGLLGGDMGLTPAADPTALAEVLPARAAWFDREHACFTDPCDLVSEGDRRILLRRLALLPESPAKTAFTEDLLRAQKRQAEEAAMMLPIRAKAVCGFAGCEALSVERAAYLPDDPSKNPLLAGAAAEVLPAQADQVTYLWQGVPFARRSSEVALEATRLPGELRQLSILTGEIELMERYSTAWRGTLAAGLMRLEASDASVAAALASLKKEEPEAAQATVLTWPWAEDAAAVRLLLKEALGEGAQALAGGVFSEEMTIIPGCPQGTLSDGALQENCRVQFAQPTEPCVALPPLSALMADMLSNGLQLLPDSFRIIHERTAEGEDRTHASFALQGRRTVVFNRVYRMDEVCVLTPGELPTVAVWPCAPFPEDKWRAYYVMAQHTSEVTVETLVAGAWQAGEERTRGEAAWSVAETERFPRYLLLKREGVCIGALPNLLPPFPVEEKGLATVSMDFGASGTALALRMEGKAAPMGGASLTRTLLHGPSALPLGDAVLSAAKVGAILPSALAVTAPGDRPLADGFICMPDASGEDVVFDLKWLSGARRQQAWRLYLGQVMLTASLYAMLHGATEIAWRMAAPDAMAPEGRMALADCLHALAEETAARTGLPQAKHTPCVTFAPESVAVGAYFRSRSEVNLKGGLTTLDIGAGGVTMALWLRGQQRPVAVRTLPLGVHMLLLDSLIAEPELVEACLTDTASSALREAAQTLKEQLRQARGSLRALSRARLALEDCFSRHLPELQTQMKAKGACTRLEALMLWRLSEVMLSCGLLLEQMYQNPTVNDLLPGVMPVAVTGRGALLLQGMEPHRQARLWRLATTPLSRSHTVRELLPLATPAPKMEAAMGLAQLGSVSETPDAAADGAAPGTPATPPDMLVQRFINAFRMEFPDAMDVLLPGAFKANGGFSPQLEQLLRGLCMQHFPQGTGQQAQYVACLHGLLDQWEQPEAQDGP